MRRRGVTLIELLVAGFLSVLMGSMLLQLFISMHTAQRTATTLPDVQWAAEDAVKQIAADLRRAPLCTVASGCTESGQVADSSLRSAAADSIRLYSRPGGQYYYYYTDSDGLKRTVSGSTPVTNTVAEGTVTLALSYMTNAANGAGYFHQSPTSPDSATWVSALSTDAELKSCSAAKVTVSVTRSGYTGSYSTIVRLRNSPKKQMLSD